MCQQQSLDPYLAWHTWLMHSRLIYLSTFRTASHLQLCSSDDYWEDLPSKSSNGTIDTRGSKRSPLTDWALFLWGLSLRDELPWVPLLTVLLLLVTLLSWLISPLSITEYKFRNKEVATKSGRLVIFKRIFKKAIETVSCAHAVQVSFTWSSCEAYSGCASMLSCSHMMWTLPLLLNVSSISWHSKYG